MWCFILNFGCLCGACIDVQKALCVKLYLRTLWNSHTSQRQNIKTMLPKICWKLLELYSNFYPTSIMQLVYKGEHESGSPTGQVTHRSEFLGGTGLCRC